jgi:hypothetical protein
MNGKNTLRLGLATLALALSTTAAQAQTYSGNTTGAPTFNRAIQDCSALSGVGVGVRYSVQAFYATTAGSYTVTSNATGLWDNFIFVYRTAFNPAAALTNCVIGDDDGPAGIGQSLLTTALMANTQYFLVTTGFAPTDFGAFTNTFSGGPAPIVLGTLPSAVVPEPSTYALMATGLIGVVGIARKRKTQV